MIGRVWIAKQVPQVRVRQLDANLGYPISPTLVTFVSSAARFFLHSNFPPLTTVPWGHGIRVPAHPAPSAPGNSFFDNLAIA